MLAFRVGWIEVVWAVITSVKWCNLRDGRLRFSVMLHRKEACMTISKELLDELLKGIERPEELLGDAGTYRRAKPTGAIARRQRF